LNQGQRCMPIAGKLSGVAFGGCVGVVAIVAQLHVCIQPVWRLLLQRVNISTLVWTVLGGDDLAMNSQTTTV
jgi:hypothetical protein